LVLALSRFGTGPWSARLALVLALGYAVGAAVWGLFASAWSAGAVWQGVLLWLVASALCAGVGWRHLHAPRWDALLLAAAGLGAIVLVNAGFARLAKGWDWVALSLFMGLFTTLGVARLVSFIMARAPTPTPTSASSTPSIAPPASPQADGAQPWPVLLLTGVGSWLAAVLVALPLIALAVQSTLAQGVMGVLLLALAAVLLRTRTTSVFVAQLFYPAFLAGTGLVLAALHQALPQSVLALLAAVLCGAAVLATQRRGVQTLMGALGCGALVGAVALGFDLEHRGLTWGLLAGLAALLLRLGAGGSAQAAAPSVQRAHAAGSGALGLAIGLAAVAAGMAMGAGAIAQGGVGVGGSGMGIWRSLDPLHSVVACASALFALQLALPQARTVAMPARWAVGVALFGLCWLQPWVGWALVTLSTALRRDLLAHTRLAMAAAFWAVLAIYGLTQPSFNLKAAVLVAAGALLLAAVFVALRAGASAQAATATPPVRAQLPRLWWAALGATALIVNVGIWGKEQIIRHGETVLVKLAPLDPRSIMQGDYMRLRFDLPRPNASETIAATRVDPRIWVAKVRPSSPSTPPGLLRFERGHTGSGLAADERLVRLKPSGHEYSLGTNAYYFPEGQAAKFERAGYGVFKLNAQGDAILVALADATGRRIE
jgi:uncharacterized membrane-anchored protein